MTADSAALGQCIYCYERFPLDELGDEHIVPLNLGGNLILPHASCSTCGEKTSAAEGHCARAMYADLRAQLGIRGRKSRRARVDMPVFLREEGKQNVVAKVSLADHPSALFAFTMTTPGILTGLPPDVETGFFPKFTPFVGHHEFADRVKRLGQYKFKITDSWNPQWIAKVLAKIGHSFAVHQIGLDAFVPLLPDLILGKVHHTIMSPTYLIGGVSESFPVAQCRHALSIGTVVGATLQKYVVVYVRLFSDVSDTPRYFVVVGKPIRGTNAASLVAFPRQ